MSRRDGAYRQGLALPQLAPEVLTDVLAKATDIAILIDNAGMVTSVLVNPNNRSFDSLDHWRSQDLRNFLTRESISKLDEKLALCAAGENPTAAIELNHSEPAAREFPISYTLHPLGAGGDILMLGRDLRPIAEVQQQLAQAQIALERDHEAQREYDARYRVLLNATSDAIVIMTMSSGRISDLNKSAAQLLGG
ncbi:MAG: PAS domain-containing protein, partial [Pseudomonadota bacterium]